MHRAQTGPYIENPYTFGEGILDRATGEIKFGQRFYTPTTGTWTQQDTLNAPLDPGNANRYQYAADNPINNTDPQGRDFLGIGGYIQDTFSSFEKAGEFVVGFAVGCVSGLGAVDSSGVGEAASVFGGPIGVGLANVGGCAVGAAAELSGASGAVG